MTTRDELIKVIGDWLDDEGHEETCGDLADRILALLPPREPTPAMVEAMARLSYRVPNDWDKAPAFVQDALKEEARAAWAAGYAAGEKR